MASGNSTLGTRGPVWLGEAQRVPFADSAYSIYRGEGAECLKTYHSLTDKCKQYCCRNAIKTLFPVTYEPSLDLKVNSLHKVCIKSPCTSISASSAVLTVHELLIQTLQELCRKKGLFC